MTRTKRPLQIGRTRKREWEAEKTNEMNAIATKSNGIESIRLTDHQRNLWNDDDDKCVHRS